MKKNTNSFIKFYKKNTELLYNPERNESQITFLLKELPPVEKLETKEYLNKLLMTFHTSFLGLYDIETLSIDLLESPLDRFQHIYVTFLTMFELKNKKLHSEFFDAKIKIGTNEEILDSWTLFSSEVTKSIEKKYGFNVINNFLTFKIVLIYDIFSIDNRFTSGKLLECYLDNHNKLRCSKHKYK